VNPDSLKVNRVKISGTLIQIDEPVLVGDPENPFLLCKALLQTDADNDFVITISAPKKTAKELTEFFHVGDHVVIIGHLSMSPSSLLQVTAQGIRLGIPKKTAEDFHLNRMDLTAYFMSKAE
jgi:hypothetical protein